MREAGWAADWKIGVCLWVERQGEVVLREPGAELLAAIGRLRSITAAAKAEGISYRQAWSIVQAINAAAGQPLVEAAVGGTKGGGARLTPRGEAALELYEQLGAAVRTTAQEFLERLAAGNGKTRKAGVGSRGRAAKPRSRRSRTRASRLKRTANARPAARRG